MPSNYDITRDYREKVFAAIGDDWIGTKDIARKSGISQPHVIRQMNYLVQAGLVDVSHVKRGTSGGHSAFTVNNQYRRKEKF